MKFGFRICFLLLIGLLIVSCQPTPSPQPTPQPIPSPTQTLIPTPETEVNFSVLVTHNESSYLPRLEKNRNGFELGAFLFKVTSLSQARRVDFILPSALEKLSNLNYEEQIALIIHQGFQPSLGYGVETERLILVEDTIRVESHFKSPFEADTGSGVQISPAVTFPYQIITIQKADLNSDVEFILIANNELISAFTPEESTRWEWRPNEE